jgi:hypothetical protein
LSAAAVVVVHRMTKLAGAAVVVVQVVSKIFQIYPFLESKQSKLGRVEMVAWGKTKEPPFLNRAQAKEAS